MTGERDKSQWYPGGLSGRVRRKGGSTFSLYLLLFYGEGSGSEEEGTYPTSSLLTRDLPYRLATWVWSRDPSRSSPA